MNTFTYIRIDVEDLTATDLRQEVIHADENAQVSAYHITINNHVERAEAVYFPITKRLGIAWGADATWADVDSLESGIEVFVNDGEAWSRQN